MPRPKDSVPYLTLVALVYLSKSQSSLALLATVKLRHSQPPFTHGQFLRGGDVNAKQMAAKGYNVSWLAHVPLKVLTYIYIHMPRIIWSYMQPCMTRLQARVIIAWLADTCVDYYHRHPDKLEFQLLAQMVFL